MIWHMGVSVLPLSMDHPGQYVSGHSGHEKPEQRIPGHPLGHGSLSLANIPLGLRIAFACLADVAAALVVCVSGRPGCTVCDIKEGFAHLIEQVLRWVLLGLVMLVICQ